MDFYSIVIKNNMKGVKGSDMMINCIKTKTAKANYIRVVEEFRSLIDFINSENILLERMFNIIKKHFNYISAGIYFNSPDMLAENVLHARTAAGNTNLKQLEKKFFKNMSEYKKIIKHKTDFLFDMDIKNQKITEELILPFLFNGKLLGGICVFANKDMLKDDLETFNLIINEFLSIFKLKYLYTEQTYKSSVDPLTGLYNRNQFDIVLNQEFNRASRYNTPFSIAMIDIDHFKQLNDTMGHQFGDYVLKEISNIIQSSLRKTDAVYRYGGEEIVIIMPETKSENAILPLEKLRRKIGKNDFKGKNVTVSIGVSDYKEKITTPFEILKKADKMLYQAKENGRNRIKKD